MTKPADKANHALELLRSQRWPGAEANRELETRLMTTNSPTGAAARPRWIFLAGAGLLLAGTALGAAAYRYFQDVHFITEDGEHVTMQLDMQPQPDGSYIGVAPDGTEALWVPAPDGKTAPGAKTFEFHTDDGKVFQLPADAKVEPAPAEPAKK